MFALFTLLFACQDPFPVDRHDLTGFRVVSLVAPEALGQPELRRPRAQLVVDGLPYTDVLPTLSWFEVPYGDDVATREISATETIPVAQGPAPTLALTPPTRLVLIAEAAGQERRAFLDLDGDWPSARLAIPAVSTAPILSGPPSPLNTVGLTRDARSAWSIEPGPAVGASQFIRLTPSLSTDPQGERVRWSATGGGTFLELDRLVTDWYAGDLSTDDEDVLLGPAATPGPITAVALLQDDNNRSADAAAVDFYVGPIPAGVFTEGRFFPTLSDPPSSGLQRFRFAADDSAPSGLALEPLGPPTEVDLAGPDPYGVAALPCVNLDPEAPFSPSALIDGRCARADLIGAEAVLNIAVQP